ncbi:MAG: hypothetical protein LUF26_04085 [Firmicutes bacterium]|nr:hypothetical protein [Bacillota bacterium]
MINLAGVKIFGAVSIALAIGFLYVLFFLNPIKRGRLCGMGKMVIVSALLMLSVIFAWFAAALSENDYSVGAFVLSIVRALQTFSLDADYESLILAAERISEALSQSSIVRSLIKGYTLGLCLAAPITGGAVLFEIIASIFPRLKLFAARLTPWREVVYFSELNEQSVAIAQSIRNSGEKFNGFKTVIVFTDAYTDKDDEKSSELLLSAKLIGAICVTDDILQIHINRLCKKRIILIDKNEASNIKALTALKEKKQFLKNADVFVFANNDAYAEVAYKIGNELNRPEKEKRKSDKGNDGAYKQYPYRIYTVNGYRQLVRNLLSEVPLYEPLVNRVNLSEYERENKKYELNITIFGTGDIGTEMFMSTYWYGQILNCQLNINVVSEESEDEFIGKINYINPDIFGTCEIVGADGEPPMYNELMRVYPDDDEITAEPYFKFRYCQTDVKDGDMNRKLTSKSFRDEFRIVDSDYIMVALGSDEDNLSAASNIGRCMETIKTAEKENKRAVVAYVIYDDALCEALNAQGRKNGNVYIHAFGSMNEVYDINNVYMSVTKKSENEIFNSYQSAAADAMQKLYESSYQYDYWSSIARALHIKYKVFSAGYINASVFDNTDKESRQKMLDEALARYKESIIPYEASNDEQTRKDNERKVNAEIYLKLSWLEHRRWNAFSRVNGFRKPAGFKLYEKTGNHKDLDLKLHSCLVEADFRAGAYDCLGSFSRCISATLTPISARARTTAWTISPMTCIKYSVNSITAQEKRNLKNMTLPDMILTATITVN